MDVDLVIQAGAQLGIGGVEPALRDHDVPIVGEVAERVGMARNRGGEGAREAQPAIALAADRKIPLLIGEAPGAKIDPARRRHELLRRRVDQLVDRRSGRGGGERSKSGGEGSKESENASRGGDHSMRLIQPAQRSSTS